MENWDFLVKLYEETGMSYREYNEQVLGWIHGVETSRGIDAEALLQNCKCIKQYAVQSNDEKLLGFSYYYTGEAFYLLNDLERLFRYINKSLGHLERSGQWKLATRAYNLLAITSLSRGNAIFALDYYLKGLSYCKKFHLEEENCIINMNIGALYVSSGEYKQAQMFYEDAFRQLSKLENCENFITYKHAIYLGLGKTYLRRGIFDVACKYMLKAEQECLEDADPIDKLHYSIFQALCYNAKGKLQQRDVCIKQIQQQITGKFALMDVFDELYDYSKMLFDIFYYKEFWEVIELLDEFVAQAKVINFQKKLLSLKIQYYKIMKDNTSYLQCTGLFYELSEILEQENSYMISGMLNVRRTLDSETKMRLEVEKENIALVEQSQTDALTGLWNRFRLNAYAEEAFERAKKRRSSFAVEILDVDFFKEYNDNYGHQAGDNCLLYVANELKRIQSNGEITAFRYGGDEFVVLYEGYSMEQVNKMMEELKSEIVKLKLAHAYSRAAEVITISQGASIGVPAKESRVWDFLQAADIALYQVKKKSRNNLALEMFREQKKEKRSVV